MPDLENGIIENADDILKELNQKLYDAGLADVIADKQAQLDLWIEENP